MMLPLKPKLKLLLTIIVHLFQDFAAGGVIFAQGRCLVVTLQRGATAQPASSTSVTQFPLVGQSNHSIWECF